MTTSDQDTRPNISRLVEPRSVALIGASATPRAWGHLAAVNLLEHSAIAGDVWLVNPHEESIEGRRTFRTIRDIPAKSIDVAMVLVRADKTIQVLEECADAGVAFAVVCTSGLAEGVDGSRERRTLSNLSRRSGMRICGPNTPGLTNVNARIGLTMAAQFPLDTTAGQIGLITQGGALGRTLMQNVTSGRGIGLWCSTGSEVDLTIVDFMNHMIDSQDLTVIAMVVEGIRDGAGFRQALGRARSVGKPVIVLKLGRTDAGARAAMSHTGAITGADDVIDAVLRREGAIRVDDVGDILETAHQFVGPRRVLSSGVAVISLSGGAATLAADALAFNGVPLADLSHESLNAVRGALPNYGQPMNPLDVTSAAFGRPEIHRNALTALVRDPSVDSIMAPIPADYGSVTERVAHDLVEISGSKLTVPVWMSQQRSGGYQVLLDAGLPIFESIERASRAIKRQREWLSFSEAPSVEPPAHEAISWPWQGAVRPRHEDEVRSLLAAYGVVGPREGVAHSSIEAEELARALGFPLVMKLRAPGEAHKSDIGGVALNLASQDAVREAYATMCSRIPETQELGVIVAEMAPAGFDLIASVANDAQFGPILTLGIGGVLVEAINRAAHRPIPLLLEDPKTMLQECGALALLDHTRGGPSSDLSALEDTIFALARLAQEHAGRIGLLEVNPLRVLPEGEGVRALDAVLIEQPRVAEANCA